MLIAKKSNVMLICSLQKQGTIDTNELLLSVNNHVLKVVTCQKILGINIDSTLSIKPHTEYMCTTISQLIGLLWRVKHFLDKKAKEMFYTSIIMAKLRYCFTIWEMVQNISCIDYIGYRSVLQELF